MYFFSLPLLRSAIALLYFFQIYCTVLLYYCTHSLYYGASVFKLRFSVLSFTSNTQLHCTVVNYACLFRIVFFLFPTARLVLKFTPSFAHPAYCMLFPQYCGPPVLECIFMFRVSTTSIAIRFGLNCASALTKCILPQKCAFLSSNVAKLSCVNVSHLHSS